MRDLTRGGDERNSLVEHALQYAARGWAVFPCHSAIERDGKLGCTCGRKSCHSPAKHPLTKRGFKDASMAPQQIEAWWRQWPWANVAIATGTRSGGLVVIDVDGSQGADELKALCATFGPLPPTLVAKTGNGWHLYFHCPTPLPSSARGHLHVRGENGYVLAPPSRHVSGNDYQAINLPEWTDFIRGGLQ